MGETPSDGASAEVSGLIGTQTGAGGLRGTRANAGKKTAENTIMRLAIYRRRGYII